MEVTENTKNENLILLSLDLFYQKLLSFGNQIFIGVFFRTQVKSQSCPHFAQIFVGDMKFTGSSNLLNILRGSFHVSRDVYNIETV